MHPSAQVEYFLRVYQHNLKGKRQTNGERKISYWPCWYNLNPTKKLWIPPYTPRLILKLLLLVDMFTDLKELCFLKFLVYLLTFLEEHKVCDPRPYLFVLLFPYRKSVLSRRLVSLVHSGPLLSNTCCLQLYYFLQRSMWQVTVVYFDLPLAPFSASTCISLWDLWHHVIFHPLQYTHLYFCQRVDSE